MIDYLVSLSVSPNLTVFLENSTVYVIQGENATLSCSASGTPVPVITWWRNDTDGNQTQISGEYFVVTTFQNGENTSVLTLLHAQPSDAGTYVCRVENVFDTVETSAVLVVYGKSQ